MIDYLLYYICFVLFTMLLQIFCLRLGGDLPELVEPDEWFWLIMASFFPPAGLAICLGFISDNFDFNCVFEALVKERRFGNENVND